MIKANVPSMAAHNQNRSWANAERSFQPELIQDRSFRLLTETGPDNEKAQIASNHARRLIEAMDRAQLALPIVEQVKR